MFRISPIRSLRATALLGASLLLFGAQISHAAPSLGQARSAALPPLTGTWYNFDPHTRNVTHLSVSATTIGFFVHTYGACEPTDCDWGNARLIVSGARASATYHFSFANVAEYLYLSGPFVRVVTETHFIDNSGRQDFTASDLFYGSRITRWVNEDAATRNITRLTFQATPSGQGLLSVYSACHPTDCAWGSQQSATTTPPVPMYFYYNQGFAQKEVVLTGTGAELQAQTFVRFTDNSGRQNYSLVERFRYAG